MKVCLGQDLSAITNSSGTMLWPNLKAAVAKALETVASREELYRSVLRISAMKVGPRMRGRYSV